MNFDEVIGILKQNANPENVKGMARFGINTDNCLGLSLPFLRDLAKKIKIDHELALQLWESKIHEAMMLAVMIADPKQITETMMESWVIDIDSWDVCDNLGMTLFHKSPLVFDKITEWTQRPEEYVKRQGFVLMIGLVLHNKKLDDDVFKGFFPLIIHEATDERKMVKKGVNWALRQIGKKNTKLNREAIKVAELLLQNKKSKSSRWIATDALRELKSEAVQERLRKRE
jgi:3-methyladenine DNA glycosylase AlkD